jgi:hypothetical protein
MALDPSLTINGTFGEVWMDGKWLTNVQSAEATGDINKQELNISGSRITRHKTMNVTFTGTLKGLKVNSQFIKAIGQVGTDRGKPFVTELILKLADPESVGAERVRLKGVQFDKIPLGKFEVNKIVEEELPFTSSGFELLDQIK